MGIERAVNARRLFRLAEKAASNAGVNDAGTPPLPVTVSTRGAFTRRVNAQT
jgi:hypothetical protein